MNELLKELAAIRKRLDAATEGPWHAAEEIDGIRAGRKTVVKREKDPRDPFRASRIVTVDQTRRHVDTWEGQGWPVEARAEDNVEFIAHSRTDVERLLDMVEGALAIANVMDSTAGAIGRLPMTEDLARELPVAYQTSAAWLRSVLEEKFNGSDS